MIKAPLEVACYPLAWSPQERFVRQEGGRREEPPGDQNEKVPAVQK